MTSFASGVATRALRAGELLSSEGKDGESVGAAGPLAVFYCEREAAEDSPPDDWRVLEPARDDKVVLRARRAQVAALVRAQEAAPGGE